MRENRQLTRFLERCRPAFAATALAIAVAACSPTVATHGNLPDAEIVKSIRIGQNNREQVQAMYKDSEFAETRPGIT